MKRKGASWFKIFYHQRKLIDSVPDDEVGRGLKAAFAYFDGEEVPELSPLALAVFISMQQYLDEAMQSYEKAVEDGRRGGHAKQANREKLGSLREPY